MQSSVPPSGTVRVVSRRIEECEGHVAEFAASLVLITDALAAPKFENGVIVVTSGRKRMTNNDLHPGVTGERG
jgi:hypothetical protein